jgi:hypothetical protein
MVEAESLALKEGTNHPLYEQYRVMDNTTPAAQALNAQMVAYRATLLLNMLTTHRIVRRQHLI